MKQSQPMHSSPVGAPQSTTQFNERLTEQLITPTQREFSKLVAELLAKLWHEEQATCVQTQNSQLNPVR